MKKVILLTAIACLGTLGSCKKRKQCEGKKMEYAQAEKLYNKAMANYNENPNNNTYSSLVSAGESLAKKKKEVDEACD